APLQNTKVPVIFILCWNRPLYLWTCLDSIYRHTEQDCKIIIADNASPDGQVRDVINGFEHRGMFFKKHFCEENDPFRLKKLIDQYADEIDDYFVIIEGDIEIMPTEKDCWLGRFLSYMEDNSNLASVGSRVYQKDFVSIEDAQRLMPDLSQEELSFLIKSRAPMRKYDHSLSGSQALFAPHNAPLRLMLFRDEAYRRIEFGRDTQIYKRFKALGYDAQISTEVVHRHLSLLNIYDYSNYSGNARDEFFDKQL
ncbi:MAG: glycosyltransferase family 2 protein, partial [Cytophagales bacterium]|nr:glycosyltransferase family 2 protein [Cytophagales bacterium]